MKFKIRKLNNIECNRQIKSIFKSISQSNVPKINKFK